jgi:hypothetical protein
LLSTVDGACARQRARSWAHGLLIFLCAWGLSCSPSGKPLGELELGSRLEPDGSIADGSLEFTFRPFSGKGTNRDLYNHIYFQGDTVCFSVRSSRPVEKRMIGAWFIDPQSGRRFAAERLDVEGNRISGFSLVGTLLDEFFMETRNKPAVTGNLDGVSVPFEVFVSLTDDSGHYSIVKSSSFIIRYAARQEQ